MFSTTTVRWSAVLSFCQAVSMSSSRTRTASSPRVRASEALILQAYNLP